MRNVFLSVTFTLWLTGCASNVQTLDRLETAGEKPRIVLMPPDIRYYRISTGGVAEPNKEWTDAAQANFASATSDYAESIGADLKIVDRYDLGPEEIRYETLHAVVGDAVKKHYFGRGKLPTKEGTFEWSLGPDIRTIGRTRDADYALFVFYRDYQASSGRTAAAIIATAAGANLETGSETGFASLVALDTGEIVWFNVVHAGSGELRDEAGAKAAVETLFRNMPES